MFVGIVIASEKEPAIVVDCGTNSTMMHEIVSKMMDLYGKWDISGVQKDGYYVVCAWTKQRVELRSYDYCDAKGKIIIKNYKFVQTSLFY